ncbi:MAG: hypothetical protein Q9215_005390 [Flavoplaca cf. flavocitrina]
MMADIYASANSVAVWLADFDRDCFDVMNLLDHCLPGLETWAKRKVQADPYSTYSLDNRELGDSIEMLQIDSEMSDNLGNFLERTYFRRAWTFQEILLARKIDMYCDTKKLDWIKLGNLLSCLERSDWSVTMGTPEVASVPLQRTPGSTMLQATLLRERIQVVESVEPVSKADDQINTHVSQSKELFFDILGNLLSGIRNRFAMDPRDHVFGVYGTSSLIAQPLCVANPLPVPDYRKPVAQVYIEYTRLIMSHATCLDLLSEIQDRQQNPAEGIGREHKDICRASGGLSAVLLDGPHTSTLSVEALYFDDLRAVGTDLSHLKRLEALADFANMLLDLPEIYVTGQPRLEVLWRAWMADQVSGVTPAPEAMVHGFYEFVMFSAL